MASVMAMWFRETAQVFRRTDATSWAASAFSKVGTVKCFIQPGSGAMGTTSGAVMSNAAYTLFCQADADIEMGDRIISANGAKYMVMFVQDDGISGTGDHMEIAMEKQAE